jgi:DNA repair exonuclease SbcCD nuclease subunit
MRFLHTSDWQLGLRRYYLDQDAQARFAADRFEAVRRLGEVARREGAACVVVAGDVFESNRVDRRTVLRGLDAMRSVELPVLLLPGNHDPLDASSLYRCAAFRDERPENVRLLDGEAAVEVAPGCEVVGAPWSSKRPLADLVAARAAALPPAAGRLRVLVAHGAVDTLAPDPDEPALIRVEAAERALAEGRFHYLALGDRHSVTRVGERIWYSGTPEATDFDEERPGRVLRVDLDASGCRVEELEVGRWRFLPLAFHCAGEADLERLRGELDALDDRSRTVLRLSLEGQLPLHARAALDRLLADAGERFAAVDRTGGGLALVPDDLDRGALDLGGYAAAAFDELLAESRGDGPEARVAADALALLYRLAGEGAA